MNVKNVDKRKNQMDDWKTFYLRYKWMPTSIIIKKYNLHHYDITNFKKIPNIRRLLEPWKISLNQNRERLFEIFCDAWKYYIVEVAKINIDTDVSSWVPKLIALKNISRKESGGFSFLTQSKYLQIICPQTLVDFRSRGFSNIALGVYQFWPGEKFLKNNGVLPFMFHQTRKTALGKIPVQDMIEHVYLNFLSDFDESDTDFAKELFFARYREQGFITKQHLIKYGVPPNLYNEGGGIRILLERIAEKFGNELGMLGDEDYAWSGNEYRKRNPDLVLDKCKYCGLKPVDLHHLLPRKEYPSLAYHEENVIPLCIQIHGLITRKNLEEEQHEMYQAAIKKWHLAKDGRRTAVFDGVMKELHQSIYGLELNT
jgi:hypothetical protein